MQGVTLEMGRPGGLRRGPHLLPRGLLPRPLAVAGLRVLLLKPVRAGEGHSAELGHVTASRPPRSHIAELGHVTISYVYGHVWFNVIIFIMYSLSPTNKYIFLLIQFMFDHSSYLIFYINNKINKSL